MLNKRLFPNRQNMTESLDIKSLSYQDARDWVVANLPTENAAGPVPPRLDGLNGFFFAISQAPVPVSASDWLGDVLPLFAHIEPASQSLNAVLSLQRHIERACENQQYPLPDTVGMDAVTQIKPGHRMNDWSLGFEAGFLHARPLWMTLVPAELRSELDSLYVALSFFASPEKARQFIARRSSPLRPEQLADQILGQFPKAADLFSRLSISVGAVAQSVVGTNSSVGRNDPCPCGSGKKYKHCCLQ
jgi:uncharacterized protein